jgi:hypothetical protein
VTQTSSPQQKPSFRWKPKGWDARTRRTGLLGEIWRMPSHPDDAYGPMVHPNGWRRLGMDFWDRSLIFSVASGAAFLSLVTLSLLFIFGFIPPKAAWVDDFRLATHYASKPINAGAVVGQDWLVLGTQGLGVQAYRRDSGLRGLWHTFDSQNTKGALPNDLVLRIASSSHGAWYAVDGGGLTWSSEGLDQWQKMIGINGFAPVSQKEITAACLSPDGRYVAVSADRAGLGVYDTVTHDWIGRSALPTPARTLAFQSNIVFAGTSHGILAFRIDSGLKGSVLVEDPKHSFGNVGVRRFNLGADWLLAVTEKQGLLGHKATEESTWQWLVGEEGLGATVSRSEDITAALLDRDALWIAVGDQVGRYELSDHRWLTARVDGSKVLSLGLFGGTVWAGTANGLYRWQEKQWTKIEQSDGRGAIRLIPTDSRLWVVTSDEGMGAVEIRSSTWQSYISTSSFGGGAKEPALTDVVIFHNEFWVSSSNAGVASYDWKQHLWRDRRAGLASPSAAVVQLLVNVDQLWALVADGPTAKPPHQVWRWSGASWKALEGAKGIQLATFDQSVWLLGSNGDLIQLGEMGVTPYYQTVAFDPSKFKSLAFDPKERHAIVASDDGILVYSLDTHSWRKSSTLSVSDLATGGGQQIWVTSNGGLLSDEGKKVLIATEVPSGSLGELVTATVWRDSIWFSDGRRLLRYDVAARKISEESFAPDVVIQQLRTAGDSIVVLGRSGDRTRHLYQLGGTSRSWQRIDKATDVTAFAGFGDFVFYIDGERGLHQFQSGQDNLFFSGGFAGIADASSVIQTSDGSFWILSPTRGLARYEPRRGFWSTSSVPAPTRMILARNSSGSEQILLASSRGLFQQDVNAIEKNIPLTSSPTLDLVEHNKTIFALGNNGAQVLQWTGSGFNTAFTFSAGTPITVTGRAIIADRATSMASAAGKLWTRHGTFAMGFTQQGTSITPTDLIDLPPEPAARLLSDNQASSLYFGTTSKCWVLRGSQWDACSSSDLMVQPHRRLTDPFGRFSWQVSALSARLDGGGLAGDHFASDRVRSLRLSGDSTLLVQSDGGVWSVRLTGSGKDLEGRTLTDTRADFLSFTETILTIPSDLWQWKRREDPTTLVDSVAIAWSGRADITRRIAGFRFSDDYATAIAYFDGKFWLGTRAGVWQLSGQGDSLMDRQVVLSLPIEGVTRLVASDRALWVTFEGGSTWRYQGGQWTRDAQVSDEILTVTDDLGGVLFRRTWRGLTTASFTRDATPRFERDKLLSIAGNRDGLWLATPAGILRSKPVGPKIPVASIDTTPSPTENAFFRDDGTTLYMQHIAKNETRFFKLDGEKWKLVQAEQTPFAEGAMLPAQLPGVPLRWIRADKGRLILPKIGVNVVDWSNGRFRSDVIQNALVSDQDVWLGTLAGLYKYASETGLRSIKSFPDSTLGKLSLVDIGRSPSGIWVKDGEGKFFTVSESTPSVVQLQLLRDTTTLVKTAVALRDGRWQTVIVPLSTPILSQDARPGENVFANDGRFRFDHVNDAQRIADSFVIATDFGLIDYVDVPLIRVTNWNTNLSELAVQRIVIKGKTRSALGVARSYRQADSSSAWQVSADMLPFLPVGVRFDESGWTGYSYDGAKQEYPISVAKLDKAPSLFAANGKFVFDNVQDLAADAQSIWLLTEPGWIRARHGAETRGFVNFAIFSDNRAPSAFVPRLAFVDQDGSLVTDGTISGRPIRLTWRMAGGAPQGPAQSPATETSDRTERDYQVTNLGQDRIVLVHGDRSQILASAAQWVWPLDVPVMHRRIPQVIQFLDDPNSVWAVTASGLIRLDKGRFHIE